MGKLKMPLNFRNYRFRNPCDRHDLKVIVFVGAAIALGSFALIFGILLGCGEIAGDSNTDNDPEIPVTGAGRRRLPHLGDEQYEPFFNDFQSSVLAGAEILDAIKAFVMILIILGVVALVWRKRRANVSAKQRANVVAESSESAYSV